MKLPPILQDKWLLRSAFARVERWHWAADAAPWSQLAAFRLDPVKHLGKLLESLEDDSYEPKAWPVVPVPKSSGEVRPYFVPDVADHVVATAFAILLAPLIERSLKPFVFGNRWYRPVRRERKKKTSVWREQPFPLHSPEMFLPYRRDYGLFRRVCHWTASAAVWGRAIDDEVKDWASRPEDHDVSRIPPFVESDWWARQSPRAAWANIDIKAFFPSVRVERLVGDFEFVKKSFNAKDYSAYGQIRGVDNFKVIFDVFDSAITWLKRWQEIQFRRQDDLPAGVKSPEEIGLPTGLGLSALLSHVALAGVDGLLQYQMKPGCGFAFLRFVDDYVIVASKPEDLIELAKTTRVQLQQSGHNFEINEKKTLPANLFDPAKADEVIKALNKLAITRDADPFVTTVVERLSELGRENPATVVGEPGERRLEELHFLGRTTVADPLMKPATVAAFAAGKLARSHPTSEGNQREVRAIRATVSQVVSQHRFKVSLWPVVVKAAARRPISASEEDDEAASRWLETMLRPYRSSYMDAAREHWWDEDVEGGDEMVRAFRRVDRDQAVVSFLRTAFWNALASALDALDRPELPTPASWVSRALDASQRRASRNQLAQHERWSAVLYPADELPTFWFEKAAHARATLAARSVDDERVLPSTYEYGSVSADDVPPLLQLRSLDVAFLGRSRSAGDRRLATWLAGCESVLVRASLAERLGVNPDITKDELTATLEGRDEFAIDSAVRARRAYLGSMGTT